MNLKSQLMMQSLSPLMILIIIKNFAFETETNGIRFTVTEFLFNNIALIIVFAFCIMWIICSTICFFSFGAFKWSDKVTGYTIHEMEEDKRASLEFVLTIIIPLLVSDVATPQGALTFFTLLFLILILLGRTELFYANPVLACLGYRLYRFTFYNNDDFKDKSVIGLCKSKIEVNLERVPIEYKKISKGIDNVLYIKEVKK